MGLETGKVIVEAAIKETKGLFNKKAVANAVKEFSEFSGEAERTVTELQQTVESQSNMILNLNREGQEAAKKLQEAQAKITYANQAVEEAQQKTQTVKTNLREALNKKYIKTEELGDGQLKTTYSKARTGFQAEVVSKPGSDEVVVDATLGDGGTTKKFKYNKKTKTIETITDTKPTVVSVTNDRTQRGIPFVTKKYSDGITEICYPRGMDGKGNKEIHTFARDGKTLLKNETFSPDGTGILSRERLGKGHTKTTTETNYEKEIKETFDDEINGIYDKYYEKELKETGQKIKFKRELDDFGILKPAYDIEITCPAKSKGIKGIINAYQTNGKLIYKNAEVEMTDGTKIIFNDFEGIRPRAYKLVNPTTGEETIVASQSTVERTWIQLGLHI